MTTAEPPPSPRVLCVDDDQDTADTTAKLLQAFGFEARACYDGHSALEAAMTYRPNVCILDLNMPGMDGDEVAREMRGQPWCPTLLVALTAMSDEYSRQRTATAGFQMHLVKPVDPMILVEAVNGLAQGGERP